MNSPNLSGSGSPNVVNSKTIEKEPFQFKIPQDKENSSIESNNLSMIKEEEIQNRRVIPDLFLGREQLRVESF
jgi:hypothetical protein